MTKKKGIDNSIGKLGVRMLKPDEIIILPYEGQEKDKEEIRLQTKKMLIGNLK